MSGSRRGVAVMVAYYVPPAAGIAAQRIRGFLRYLPALGWDPVLVAPASVHHHVTSPEGDGAAIEGRAVVRVANPEPSRWFRHLAGVETLPASQARGVRPIQPVRAGRVGRILRRLVREWVYLPDAQTLWIPGASRAAAEMVRTARGRPTVVFSTSVPFSCHFAARRAARATGAPWVAEYRDPWSVAPPQFGRRSVLRQLVDTRLDHDLVAAAAHLVYTSEATSRCYREAFPDATGRGVSVVRNGFDTVVEDSAPGPNEPLRLAHSGTLLSPTYAGTLLAALRTLEGEAPGQVVLDVYGPPDPWTVAAPDAPSFLRLHGWVGPDQMPRNLSAASALVLLQPEARHGQYIAGKLYEYLGARRPVLAALPAECEASKLIRDHGELWPLSSSDAGVTLGTLRRLLAAHRQGAIQGPRVAAASVEALSREAQTAVLAGVFDQVTGRV